MKAVGALSLEVDTKMHDRLAQANRVPEDHPDSHRRNSLRVAFQDITENVRGKF